MGVCESDEGVSFAVTLRKDNSISQVRMEISTARLGEALRNVEAVETFKYAFDKGVWKDWMPKSDPDTPL